MGVGNKLERHDLPVSVRSQLVALHKELTRTTKALHKLIGDPRRVVRPCKGCGLMCTARELRAHECNVARSQR